MTGDRSIVVDGSAAPSEASSWSPERYEHAVRHVLETAFSTHTGRIVRDSLRRRLTIQPWPNESNCNADAAAERLHRATPEGQQAHYCSDFSGTWIIETGQPMFSESGRPVMGIGGGSDAIVRFTPTMWMDAHSCAVHGPGSGPDEILLHEIVHAARSMAGLSNCHPATRGYDTFEEVVAILITNMHQSELGRPLRRNHQGFAHVFGRERYYNDMDHVGWVTRLCRQQPALTQRLSQVPYDRCPFNPFLSHY